MSQSNPIEGSIPRESIDSVLAKNLVAARLISGLTQSELSLKAGISRATIAQLEAGISDPRVSTVVILAEAMRLSPLTLLVSAHEVRAVVELLGQWAPALGDHFATPERERIRALAATGLLKDRVRAARLGAAAARAAGYSGDGASATAAIFAAIDASATILGAELAQRINARRGRCSTQTPSQQ